MKNRAVILIGGNLGDQLSVQNETITLVSEFLGAVSCCSSVWYSEPWGFDEDVPGFWNQVLVIATALEPEELLREGQRIEAKLGRKCKTGDKYQSRVMDVDILFYNDAIIDTAELTIPHPLMHQRRFVLSPLSEVLPEYRHPVYEKPVAEMLTNCTDPLKVWRKNDE